MRNLILACLPFFFVGLSWKDIWSGVGDAAGSIARTLTRWLEQVANNVWDAIMALGRSVGDAGNWVGHNIWDRVGDLMQLIWNAADVAWRGVAYTLGGVANIVHDALGAVKDAGTWAIGNLGNIVADAARAAKDAGTWALGNLGNVIHDVVDTAWKGVAYALGGFANIIHDALSLFSDKLWTRLGDLLGGVQDAAGKVEGLPEAALNIALDHKEDILKAYLLGFPLDLLASLPELLERAGPAVVGALRVDGKDLQTFAGDTFDSILGLLVGTGRIEPEDAPGLIARSLGVATAAGLAAQVPGIVQGLIPTENPLATNYVAGFLGKFSGWDHYIEAGLGVAVALALRRPMEYHLNKKSLTNEPRPGDIAELYGRRLVDRPTFDETLHRHGFGDDWGAPMGEAAYHPLKKFELKMIAESTNLPENALTFFLENAGYRPEAVPLMIKALQDTALKTAVSARLTQARNAYGDGYIDLSTFHAMMDDLGIDAAQQDIWVLAAQLDYSNGVKTELLAAYRSAAGRDALSDDELRAACAQLGLTSDKIEVEVARAQAARLKKPVDKTAVEQQAAVNKARATMTEAYLIQFKKGALDEQTLLAALSFIGVPDVQANACVALAKAQSLVVPTAPPVDTPEMVNKRALKDLQDAYVLQYQHDLLDAEQLRAALTGTGMAPSEADAITLREQARKTPSPVVANKRTEERVTMEAQDALASAYVNQYQGGFINADALESNLVSIGLDPRVAHSRRLLEESKAYGLSTKARQTTEDQAASQLAKADQTVAVEAYRKGVIDADTLEASLVDIGLSPALAASIRQYEEIHALTTPKAPTTPA
jgi:hypothetical protein